MADLPRDRFDALIFGVATENLFRETLRPLFFFSLFIYRDDTNTQHDSGKVDRMTRHYISRETGEIVIVVHFHLSTNREKKWRFPCSA